MENNYYIYFHINPVLNKIFYVGKGRDKRAWSKTSRSDYWRRTVKKYNYVIDIVEDGLTEDEAFQREIFYIQKIGRDKLCNLTDGGEGSSGYKHNDISLKKMNGLPKSEEAKLKMSLSKKGKPSWNKNTNLSGMKNKKHSEDTLQKMSEVKKGVNNPYSKEIIWHGKKYGSIKELHNEISPNITYESFCRKIKNNKLKY